MSPARKARRIREHLESRIAHTLEWYEGCDAVPETLTNIKRELISVLDEVCRKFGITSSPFLLTARFDGNQIVVSTIDRKMS